MKKDPEEMLAFFDPSPSSLLDFLRTKIDDSMLREISEADYSHEAEKHFQVLKEIRDEYLIPSPLEWHPAEALELMRWSEPENPKWKPGAVGERGHLMRAFCSAVLILAAVKPGNQEHLEGMNQTIVQLVDSAYTLGEEIQKKTLSLFAWLISRTGGQLDDDEEVTPFLIFSILLLSLNFYHDQLPEETFGDLADWLSESEASIRKNLEDYLPDYGNQWLLGLTFHNIKHDKWKSLAQQLIKDSEKIHDVQISEKVALIGKKVKGRA